MNKKQITITIDLDTGEATLEADGYTDRSCATDMEPLAKALGKTKLHKTTKPKDQNVLRQQRT